MMFHWENGEIRLAIKVGNCVGTALCKQVIISFIVFNVIFFIHEAHRLENYRLLKRFTNVKSKIVQKNEIFLLTDENGDKITQKHTLITFVRKDHIIIPNYSKKEINCSALFAGDVNEQKRADFYQKFHPIQHIDYEQITKNCSKFTRDNFIMHPLSEEEANFAIAYSILTYRNERMTFRLLRAIYRPQNFYCIHIDKKSPHSLHENLKAIVKCLPNVFIASKLYNVTWGGISSLFPEITCMQDLWKYKWEYFINLTGEEFPLQTNKKIVQILKSLNGLNDITGYINIDNKQRWRNLENQIADNITLRKGSVNIAATRGFVDYVLHNPISHRFLRWVEKTENPDETYFPSLSHSPQLGVPGAKAGEDAKLHCKFKLWFRADIKKMRHTCHGKKVHSLCIFSIKDLPLLYSRTEMFVNKLHEDFEPLAYDCLEELYFKKVRFETNIDT